ncbi:MAG: helix-turn-helix domain-containing protein [Flavobacteriia bacterium]|jgi:AraC-like DNA-binding protein
MKKHIKNMVSNRCINQVSGILIDMGIPFEVIELGEVTFEQNLSMIQELDFQYKLKQVGLDLISDAKMLLSERIKLVIIQMIHYSDEHIKTNFSVYLSEKTNLNYTYLSNVFRTENNMTIQQFIIIHKIERIKELLLYGEMNLSEISYKMHYSSIAHLSNQFKKITGLSPTEYRQLDVIHRIPLEEIGNQGSKPLVQRKNA